MSKYFPQYGSEDTHGINLQIKVTEGYLTPKTVWADRFKINNDSDEKRKNWETLMNEDQKETIIIMTKNALARMWERADKIVPPSFECEPGKYLDFTVRFLYTDVDAESSRRLDNSQLMTKQAEQEIREMFVEGGEYAKINIVKDDGTYSSATVTNDLVDDAIEFYTNKGWMAARAED